MRPFALVGRPFGKKDYSGSFASVAVPSFHLVLHQTGSQWLSLVGDETIPYQMELCGSICVPGLCMFWLAVVHTGPCRSDSLTRSGKGVQRVLG